VRRPGSKPPPRPAARRPCTLWPNALLCSPVSRPFLSPAMARPPAGARVFGSRWHQAARAAARVGPSEDIQPGVQPRRPARLAGGVQRQGHGTRVQPGGRRAAAGCAGRRRWRQRQGAAARRWRGRGAGRAGAGQPAFFAVLRQRECPRWRMCLAGPALLLL
jgi:hypothetical protein